MNSVSQERKDLIATSSVVKDKKNCYYKKC